MKKNTYQILFTLLALGVGLFYTSCSNDTEELFDKSASERLEAELNTYHALLTSSENGWAMEYFPGGQTQKYGGVALTVKFTDKTATFASAELSFAGKTATSLYSLRRDIGASLSFDSYNEIFHYYSDSNLSIGDGIGSGLLGDFEFAFVSHTDNEVLLRGKRHQSMIRMYKLQKTSEEYLKAARDIEATYTALFAKQGLEGTFGKLPVVAHLENEKYYRLEYGDEKAYLSFMFTDTGIKLYEPVTLGGHTVSELTWNADAESFTAADGTELRIVRDKLAWKLEDLLGAYTMTYNDGKTVNGGTTVDVQVVQEPDGILKLEGLPFVVQLRYNSFMGVLVIAAQTLDATNNIVLALLDMQARMLNWTSGVAGMFRWDGNSAATNHRFVFTDAGTWPGNFVDGFAVLKVGGGLYSGYGGTGVYSDIVLTKK